MEFNETTNFILNVIIWAILYIVMAFFLIEELKSEWQLMRIDNGLSNKSRIVAPKKSDKDENTGILYKNSHKKVFKLGAIISIFIFLTFIVLSPIKHFEFNNFANVMKLANTILYALLFFSAFIGLGTDIELDNHNDIKFFNQIINVIKKLKRKHLQNIVSEEIMHIKDLIEEKIKKIYGDKNSLGCLITRVDGKFLDSLIDEKTENYERKVMSLQDYSLKLLNLYDQGKPTLLDELNVFLKDKLPDWGVPLCEIVSYINNTEIIAKEENYTQDIKKHIKENLESNKDRKSGKSITKSNVMEILLKNHQSNLIHSLIDIKNEEDDDNDVYIYKNQHL